MLYKHFKDWNDEGTIVEVPVPDEAHFLDECFSSTLKNDPNRSIKYMYMKEAFENICQKDPDFTNVSTRFKEEFIGSIFITWETHLAYSKQHRKEMTIPTFNEVWRNVYQHFRLISKVNLINEKYKVESNDLEILKKYESVFLKSNLFLKELGFLRTTPDPTIPEKFTFEFLIKNS